MSDTERLLLLWTAELAEAAAAGGYTEQLLRSGELTQLAEAAAERARSPNRQLAQLAAETCRRLLTALGWDKVRGGTGQKDLLTALGWDKVRGGTGQKDLLTALGWDKVRGGTGQKDLLTGLGWDKVRGGTGQKDLLTALGWDKVRGGTGQKDLLTGLGWDKVRGGTGQKDLLTGLGWDKVRGGTGQKDLVRRREPPTPYGRDPGRRGVRSPGTGGRCGPFGTVIRHPVPPPQSPTRRPPRQLPVSTVKARPCPVCAPLRPAPAHLSASHRRTGHRRRSSEEPGRAS